MTELDVIVETVARTFRPGAPLVIDDIRFAAKVDGYDLSGATGGDLARSLRRFCTKETGPHGPKDRKSWRCPA